MTYKAKLAMEHPDKIDVTAFGGCIACPYDYGYSTDHIGTCGHPSEDNCTKCWSREIPGTEPTKLVAEIKPQIDVSLLINEAMEKKDRTVYILCHDGNMSIDVKPYTESDPRWIAHDDIPVRGRRKFECSECHCWSSEAGCYCQFRGEKLRMPTIDDFKKENNNE